MVTISTPTAENLSHILGRVQGGLPIVDDGHFRPNYADTICQRNLNNNFMSSSDDETARTSINTSPSLSFSSSSPLSITNTSKSFPTSPSHLSVLVVHATKRISTPIPSRSTLSHFPEPIMDATRREGSASPATSCRGPSFSETHTTLPGGAIILKRGMACSHCRQRRIKCSGDRPACKVCVDSNRICDYKMPGRQKRKAGSESAGPEAQVTNDSPLTSIPLPNDRPPPPGQSQKRERAVKAARKGKQSAAALPNTSDFGSHSNAAYGASHYMESWVLAQSGRYGYSLGPFPPPNPFQQPSGSQFYHSPASSGPSQLPYHPLPPPPPHHYSGSHYPNPLITSGLPGQVPLNYGGSWGPLSYATPMMPSWPTSPFSVGTTSNGGSLPMSRSTSCVGLCGTGCPSCGSKVLSADHPNRQFIFPSHLAALEENKRREFEASLPYQAPDDAKTGFSAGSFSTSTWAWQAGQPSFSSSRWFGIAPPDIPPAPFINNTPQSGSEASLPSLTIPPYIPSTELPYGTIGQFNEIPQVHAVVADPGAPNALDLSGIKTSQMSSLSYEADIGSYGANIAGPSNYMNPTSSLDMYQPNWEGMTTEASEFNLPYNGSVDHSESWDWEGLLKSSENAEVDGLRGLERPGSSTSQLPAQGGALMWKADPLTQEEMRVYVAALKAGSSDTTT